MAGRYGAGSDLELVSPLPLERCQSLLAAGIDTSWATLGHQPVIGKVSGKGLRARKRIRYNNGFQTWVFAELVEQAGRTHVRCRFSVHPVTRAGMIVWFGFALLVGAVTFAQNLTTFVMDPSKASEGVWVGVLVPIVMPLSGLGLVAFGRCSARNERRFLLDFLCETLRAVPADGRLEGQAATHHR